MQVMQTFFCSFKLPNFPTQKIITGDFGCKGSGITIGVTDGDRYCGLRGDPTNDYIYGRPNFYGLNVGSSISGTGTVASKTIGLTTDTSKSGIITDTSGFKSVNVCIKF